MLTDFLAASPVLWRHYLKRRMFEAVAAGGYVEWGVQGQMQRLIGDLSVEFQEILT